MQTIPLARIGPVQLIDLEKSTGCIKLYDEYARICTIIKQDSNVLECKAKWCKEINNQVVSVEPKQINHIGDQSPYRMSKLFGNLWSHYNHQFVIQVSGCPFQCPFCYVDNLKEDTRVDAPYLVDLFKHFREKVKADYQVDVNVFHLMGGDPAHYASFWPILRDELDSRGFDKVVLFSDCLLVEDMLYDVKPWEYVDIHHFILASCLKGTNWINFKDNTGCDLYMAALFEAMFYKDKSNCYFTLINFDSRDLKKIYDILPKKKIDLLTVYPYEVSVRRKKGELNNG